MENVIVVSGYTNNHGRNTQLYRTDCIFSKTDNNIPNNCFMKENMFLFCVLLSVTNSSDNQISQLEIAKYNIVTRIVHIMSTAIIQTL